MNWTHSSIGAVQEQAQSPPPVPSAKQTSHPLSTCTSLSHLKCFIFHPSHGSGYCSITVPNHIKRWRWGLHLTLCLFLKVRWIWRVWTRSGLPVQMAPAPESCRPAMCSSSTLAWPGRRFQSCRRHPALFQHHRQLIHQSLMTIDPLP